MRSETIEEDEAATIARALLILRRRLKHRSVFSSAQEMKQFLQLQAEGLQHEVFGVMYLDARNQLIDYEQLFRGTITKTTVYPREIVKGALLHNATALVLHHNHPSGFCQPSLFDEALTIAVKAALALVDVGVMDHVITSDEEVFSMAEAGTL